jgi:hypothetical protein
VAGLVRPAASGTWVTTFGRTIQRWELTWELTEDPSERLGTQLSLLDDT